MLQRKRSPFLVLLPFCAGLLSACEPLDTGVDGAVSNVLAEDAAPPDANKDGPLVSVLSPSEVSNLSSGSVLTTTDVEVRCQVEERKADSPVDPSSVNVFAYVGDRESPELNVHAAGVGGKVYVANLSLLNFPAGKVRIQCTASDTHWPVRSGVGAISTYLDRGPRVTISSPVDGSAVARRDKVLVRYSVEEARLSPTDDQASIAQTSLVVNGRTLNPVAEAGTTFSYELDLKDLSMFPETQGELKVEVRSTNRRSPTPATSTTLAQLKIDGDGPVIDVMSPYDATFVGQTTQVTARIRDDGTGIKQESVRATITIDDHTDSFPLEAGDPAKNEMDLYRASIDSGRYLERAQLTVNIIAEDRAGNETRVSKLVFVDSVPPWVSLEAPDVRVRTGSPTDPTGYACSAPFDPLGEDSVKDLQTLTSKFGLYRAVVWERGVELKGQQITNVGSIKADSAALYVQGKTSTPLIVDSDGDGVCDRIAINPEPTQPQLAPVRVPLGPILFVGAYPAGISVSNDAAPAVMSYCGPSPSYGPVQPICPGTTMTYALKHTALSAGPAIYTVSPSQNTGPGCTGQGWQASVDSGWACVVGTATDAMGNVGISKPLRVCYNLDGAPTSCAGAPPSCTDGCRMPDVFAATGMPPYVDQ